MNRSAKIHYALKALIELAQIWPVDNPLQVQIIAQRQNVPVQFLTQILLILKQHNIVRSIRGQKGGYCLNKDPSDLTLWEVFHILGSNDDGSERPSDGHAVDLVLKEIWQELDHNIRHYLENITLTDLMNRLKMKQPIIDFEI